MKRNFRSVLMGIGQLAALFAVLFIVGCEAPVGTSATAYSIVKAARGEWAPSVAYAVGDTVTYNGVIYTCLQAHTSLVGWEPATTPALWQAGGSSGPTPTPTPTPVATPTPSSGATPTPTPVNTPTPTPGSSIPYGQSVWIRASANGDYVSADQSLANTQLIANRTAPQGWETFQIVNAGSGLVALKASNGMYVSADKNIAAYAPLVANRTTYGAWEEFQWVDLGSNQFSLKALSTGNFVSADVNRSADLVADRTSAGGWETFTWGTGTVATPTPSPTPVSTPTPTPTPTSGPQQTLDVMTWVPGYGQSVWKAALTATWGGTYYPRNTLTRVAAQFFQVQSNGGIVQNVADSDVQWVQNYTKSNGIQFLACVHDYDNGGTNNWNWNMATSAFANNRTTLVNNIVALVNKWGADGADIDFEGNEGGDPYRTEFGTFIRALGASLHAQGKKLTVDVFPNVWNQPNSNWWPDWVGYVDSINSMGYDAIFGGGSGWQAYRWQQDTALAAGYKVSQFAMGMPAWVDNWGSGGLGTSALAHVNEVLSGNYNRFVSSVAIWDAQFNTPGWQTPQVWEALHRIKTTPTN